jgi:hypothetical protein
VGDHEEGAGEIGPRPRAARDGDAVQQLELFQLPGRHGREDQHVCGAPREQRLDLPLAHRQRPDHDAAPVGELEQDREPERHQQATV